MKLTVNQALIAAGLLLAVYVIRKTSQGAAAVAAGLNPANPDNVVNSGVDAVMTTIVGRDASLGSWVYDALHPNEFPWLTQ